MLVRVLRIVLLSVSFCLLLFVSVGLSGAFALATDNPGQKNESRNDRGRSDNLIRTGQVRQVIARDKSIVLVDVRLPADYKKYRIPDSLNIPLSFVKTKRFLANRSVVFINNGFLREVLNNEIDRLKSSGFLDVAILAGGITDWRRTGGPVEGDLDALRQAKMVSPADFHVEQNRSGLVVVNAAGNDSAGQGIIAHAVHIPFKQKGRQDFRNKVIASAVPHSRTGLPDVLVFSENADKYQEIETLLADIGVNIFFLEGGLAAYRDFLEKQENLKNPKTVFSGDTACPICPKP